MWATSRPWSWPRSPVRRGVRAGRLVLDSVARRHDAALVLVAIGDLIDFTYTGSSPWASRQLVGSYAHHITPDSWDIEIKAYPAIIETQWDAATWDVDWWSIGA